MATTVTYAELKAKLEAGGGLSISPSVDGGVMDGQTGTFSGTVTIEVPQLPDIRLPIEDELFSTDFRGNEVPDLFKLLGLKKGNGGMQNNSSKSQIIINSNRLILNSREDYLMLFGQQGVVISSKNNVNIDADEAVTIYGEDGLFLGVPGKGKQGKGNQKEPKTKAQPTKDNDYEPLVLGNKLANLLEDLIVTLVTATIVTPVGKGYFREDVGYNLLCLKARLPEILSNWGYVDGISHEGVDPAPEEPKTVTEPPTTLTGTVSGTFATDSANMAMDPNAPSTTITNPLADQPGFYESVELY